jgi:hypothetical protein
MGFFDGLFSTRTENADELHDAILDVVQSIDFEGSAALPELKFRDELARLFSNAEVVKREYGVGQTSVDLYLHDAGHDFLITIKRGLNAQKVKMVMGEITELLDVWRPRVPNKRTYIIFCTYGLKRVEEWESITPFKRFMETHSSEKFSISLTMPTGESTKKTRRKKA